jgi:hypothetical protein
VKCEYNPSRERARKHKAAAATYECAPSETIPTQEALEDEEGGVVRRVFEVILVEHLTKPTRREEAAFGRGSKHEVAQDKEYISRPERFGHVHGVGAAAGTSNRSMLRRDRYES